MPNDNYEEEYKRKLEEVARFPDMNPGPVLRLDHMGVVLLSNAAAQNLFGQDLLGKNWKTICSGITEKILEAIISYQFVYPVEAIIGGKCFLFNHRCDFNANLVFVFGSDITALKDLKKKLREMVRFPEMNPGPVIRTNMEGIVLLNNSAARKAFGEDMLGKSWLDIWPSLKDDQWNKILTSPEVFPVEVLMNNCDYVFNHRRDFESDFVFIFGTDITIQKKLNVFLHKQRRWRLLEHLQRALLMN